MNVLLTAVGCPGGPSIIEAVRADKNLRIIGTDVRPDVPGKYLVDAFHTVPKGKDPSYVDAMLDLVQKEQIKVILPLATFELLALAKARARFEAIGCQVCVSDYDPLLTANDRYRLYNAFADHSFVPDYAKLKNGDQILDELKAFGFPENPVVIKPFISHGSIGLRIVQSDLDLYEQFINHKPNTIKIAPETAAAIFKDKNPDNILLSEFLPGKEFGVDMLVHPETGKIIQAFARDNGEVFHSEISNGKLIEQENLISIAQHIVDTLGLKYTINIDFKLRADGSPMLLEINPRMPATSYLAYSAGFNLALSSIYLAVGRAPVPITALSYDRNIYSYRGFLVRNDEGEVLYRC